MLIMLSAPSFAQVDGTHTSSVSSVKSSTGVKLDSGTAGDAQAVAAHSNKAPLVFLNQLDQLMLSCYSCICDT